MVSNFIPFLTGIYAFKAPLFLELNKVLADGENLAGRDMEDVFTEVICRVSEDFKSNAPSRSDSDKEK